MDWPVSSKEGLSRGPAAIECRIRYRALVEPLAVGSFTPSVLLDVAERTGRLRERRLTVVEVPVPSSPAQFESLLAGDLAVALTSPDNVLAYRYEPANPLGRLLDARILAGIDRGMGLGLYARPGLAAADLDGAVVGVDVPTSGFALALYALADSLGVRRDRYRLVNLGSTPRRLEALLAGDCAATMLNAGNELLAERAGCELLAAASDHLTPYLGTVVAVVGEKNLPAAARLTEALLDTSAEIAGGGLDAETAASAADRLGLDDDLARRYVDRLRDPLTGLVSDGVVDRGALETLVRLRTTYLPKDDGSDPLADALVEGSGLVQPP
jgi:ABC-type nitrate/sulfonate/bicarbonate transport system substrate-binding protein